MRNVGIIMRRELASYFATPLAYVFIVIFLLLANWFAFYLGAFYERGQADLDSLFGFLPWLFLFLIPALSMKLWAEERKSGSIELLMTQPVTLREAVLGKFLAAWIFTAFALALTFPLWRMPRAAARRFPRGHRCVPQLGATADRGSDRIAVVPRSFRLHQERRHRRARPVVLRDADQLLPAGDRHRARSAQSGLAGDPSHS